MATKIFDVAEMVCEDVQAYVKSAKFCTGNDDAPVYAQCDDGAFVTLGKLCADSTYAGMSDYNCKYAYAPTSDEVAGSSTSASPRWKKSSEGCAAVLAACSA